MFPFLAKDLKDILKNVPDDALISYERILDVYFNEHGWDVELVRDDAFSDGPKDEYIQAETAYYDKDSNNLRISAHY